MAIKEASRKLVSDEKSTQFSPVRQCLGVVDAHYYNGDDLLLEYKSNPLISALGPVWDKVSVLKALNVPVAYAESERMKSEEYRLHAIGRLSRLMVALPAHLDVVSTVQITVR